MKIDVEIECAFVRSLCFGCESGLKMSLELLVEVLGEQGSKCFGIPHHGLVQANHYFDDVDMRGNRDGANLGPDVRHNETRRFARRATNDRGLTWSWNIAESESVFRSAVFDSFVNGAGR